jgi:hypothetical protein
MPSSVTAISARAQMCSVAKDAIHSRDGVVTAFGAARRYQAQVKERGMARRPCPAMTPLNSGTRSPVIEM